jgi:hypothetical protein
MTFAVADGETGAGLSSESEPQPLNHKIQQQAARTVVRQDLRILNPVMHRARLLYDSTL